MAMLERVRQYIRTHQMFTPGELVIVAVSGGPDSVALLHLLDKIKGELGIDIHVFHLDHGLRGDQSAEDALFVRQLADRLNLASTIVGLGPEVLKRRGGSLQAAARLQRLEELCLLAQRLSTNKVAVGHNQDDQAETVLMRVLRGTGLRGLTGIHPARQVNGLTFVRPLLATPRLQIDQYCRDNELLPRYDESNSRPDYLRNRIRLELLPMLRREYNPAILRNLADMAGVLQEEDALMEEIASEALARAANHNEERSYLAKNLLAEQVAVLRRSLRMAARRVMGPDYDLGLQPITNVIQLLLKSHGSHRLDLPGGLQAFVEYGHLQFVQPQAQTFTASEWQISPSGVTEIPELGIRVLASHETGLRTWGTACFDQDLLPGPLTLRFRNQGDRIYPVGMKGSKKLQDILVDAKVPQRIRGQIPLLTSGEEVCWLIGYRLDRRFLATDSTTNPLLLRVTKGGGEARNALTGGLEPV